LRTPGVEFAAMANPTVELNMSTDSIWVLRPSVVVVRGVPIRITGAESDAAPACPPALTPVSDATDNARIIGRARRCALRSNAGFGMETLCTMWYILASETL
jgi:hypothetical protein